MNRISDKWQWFVAAAVFTCCMAPTFISYQSYVFRWDDAGYLHDSIMVSRVFWSGSAHGVAHLRDIANALRGIRPPAMLLLGLPWGPLVSWDAAGKCFLTLAAVESLLAAFCFLLMARIGVNIRFLIPASICVFAALGPLPPGSGTNRLPTSFMADDLFAWICLASLLLIPYETGARNPSRRHAVFSGVLWGVVLSAGVMTKISFLYFIALVLPTLLVVRFRHKGLRSALWTLLGFASSSLFPLGFLLKYGRSALANGADSSFGGVATLYKVSPIEFLTVSLRESPGLVFFLALVAAALGYLTIKRRSLLVTPAFLSLLIAIGFGAIVLASVNREIRFLFPVILSVPFLLAVILSGDGVPVPPKPAGVVAGLVFCVLAVASLPAYGRAHREASLGRSDAVLARAINCRAQSILLATDSRTLNQALLSVAGAITSPASNMRIASLADNAVNHISIDQDFEQMHQADQVVFQDDNELSPPFTNQRVLQYRRYMGQQPEYFPIKDGEDVVAYSRGCGQ